MNNGRVASILRNHAGLLELKGESPFRVKAYRAAATVIEGLAEDVGDICDRDELTRLPRIGKDLAGKIREILQTGTMSAYEEVRREFPPALLDFLSLPRLHPLAARYLYEGLGIRSLDDLEDLVRTHMLRTLPEIDHEAEQEILQAIRALRQAQP